MIAAHSGYSLESAKNAENATYRRNFVYDPNWLLFRFMAFFGQTPIRRNNEGKLQVKYSDALTIVAVCIAILIAAAGIFTGYLVLYNLLNKPMGFEMTMVHLTMLAIPFLEFVSIASLYEMQKFVDYLTSWGLFQDRFKEVTGIGIKPRRYLNPILIFCASMTAIAMLARLLQSDAYDLLGEIFSYSHFVRAILVSHSIPISIILGGYCYIWALLTTSVEYAAECFLAQLSRKMVSGPMTSQQAEDIADLYLLLRSQCVGLGECLGLTFLYISAFKFMLAMPSLYFGAKRLVCTGDALPLMAAFISVLFISVYTEYAHRASSKVGRQLEDELTKLLRSGNTRSNRHHLVALLQTVMSTRPQISLIGYFNMDRSVNISMYSSLITFLIIIVQFGKD